MKKVLVVGGGVVGITASYFSRKNGNKVTLVEASDRLGGLLGSDCNDAGCFDYGTHIASKTGVKELDIFLFSDFNQNNSYQFNLSQSGNFFLGRLSDISPYVNSNYLDENIYRKGCSELLKGSSIPGSNLKETLINRYGHTFYKAIFKGVVNKFFGCDSSELSNDCLNFFDMNRLLAFNKKITLDKKKNKIIDNKIGFHTFSKGVDKAYPEQGGIGQWVKYLEEKLVKQEVSIQTQAQITKIEKKEDKFFVTINDQISEFDELVWTLSSGLLNTFLPTGLSGRKPSFRKTAVYDFVFDKRINTNSFYINVYDSDFLSSRITFYQNLKNKKDFYACTVEVLNGAEFNFEKSINIVERELSRMGLVGLDNQCLFSQCRVLKEGFPVLTNNNVKALMGMNSYYEKEYENLTLLGRGSAKGFFMSELLISAYQEMQK